MSKPFYNQASVTFNNTTKVSNTVEGTINDVLSITKTAIYDKYDRNSIIAFWVTITNNSQTEFNDLTLTENMGEKQIEAAVPFSVYPLTYVNDSLKWSKDGILQTTPINVSITDNMLVVKGLGVSAKGIGTGITNIVYEARANEYAPMGTLESAYIENISALSGDGIPSDMTASAIITPYSAADLEISKNVYPTEISQNGQLSYTLLIQNYGLAANNEFVVSDTFSPYLNDITITVDDMPLSKNYYSYTEDGLFTTTAGALSINAANYIMDENTGVWNVFPATARIVISGKAAV